MTVSETQSSIDSHHILKNRLPWDERDRPREAPPRRLRRRSLCMPLDSATDGLISQMMHTFNYSGFKPNLRSHSIHGPFLTLGELYQALPEGAPLHVELSRSTMSTLKPRSPRDHLLSSANPPQNTLCSQKRQISKWTRSRPRSTSLSIGSSK